MDKRLINVLELSEAIGVSRAQIYRLIAKGLPVMKVGNNTRFDLDDVMRWIRNNQ